jgi:hypothetical protein
MKRIVVAVLLTARVIPSPETTRASILSRLDGPRLTEQQFTPA